MARVPGAPAHVAQGLPVHHHPRPETGTEGQAQKALRPLAHAEGVLRQDVGREVVVHHHGKPEGVAEDPLQVYAVKRGGVHAENRAPARVVGPPVHREADPGHRDRSPAQHPRHALPEPGQKGVRRLAAHVGGDALEGVDVTVHVHQPHLGAGAADVHPQGQRGAGLLQASLFARHVCSRPGTRREAESRSR